VLVHNVGSIRTSALRSNYIINPLGLRVKFLNSGSFKLNGIEIRINSNSSMEEILNKINSKKHITGIEASYVKNGYGYKLIFESKEKIVNIMDRDGVFGNLYQKNKLGKDDRCLVQVIRNSAYGRRSDVIINYNYGKNILSQHYNNAGISGYNKAVVSEYSNQKESVKIVEKQEDVIKKAEEEPIDGQGVKPIKIPKMEQSLFTKGIIRKVDVVRAAPSSEENKKLKDMKMGTPLSRDPFPILSTNELKQKKIADSKSESELLNGIEVLELENHPEEDGEDNSNNKRIDGQAVEVIKKILEIKPSLFTEEIISKVEVDSAPPSPEKKKLEEEKTVLVADKKEIELKQVNTNETLDQQIEEAEGMIYHSNDIRLPEEVKFILNNPDIYKLLSEKKYLEDNETKITSKIKLLEDPGQLGNPESKRARVGEEFFKLYLDDAEWSTCKKAISDITTKIEPFLIDGMNIILNSQIR